MLPVDLMLAVCITCHRLVSNATAFKKEMTNSVHRFAIFFLEFFGSSASSACYCDLKMWEEETSMFLSLFERLISDMTAKLFLWEGDKTFLKNKFAKRRIIDI
jgi:hypothetical protein